MAHRERMRSCSRPIDPPLRINQGRASRDCSVSTAATTASPRTTSFRQLARPERPVGRRTHRGRPTMRLPGGFMLLAGLRRRSRVMRSRRPAQTASATSSPKRTDLASRPALSKYAWQRLCTGAAARRQPLSALRFDGEAFRPSRCSSPGRRTGRALELGDVVRPPSPPGSRGRSREWRLLGAKQPNGHYTGWSGPWFDCRSEQSFRASD